MVSQRFATVMLIENFYLLKDAYTSCMYECSRTGVLS